MKRTLVTIALTLAAVWVYEWQTFNSSPYPGIFAQTIRQLDNPFGGCINVAYHFPHWFSKCERD